MVEVTDLRFGTWMEYVRYQLVDYKLPLKRPSSGRFLIFGTSGTGARNLKFGVRIEYVTY